MRRLKVLLSAYACQPHRGSELGVGWHWAQQAAREHEVWVLTHEHNRGAVEAELRAHPNPHLHFVFRDVPAFVKHWRERPGYLHLQYAIWQCLIPPQARRLHREVGFDVVHHLTYNTIEVPGFLFLLGAPFIWGPVGGAQLAPRSLRAYYGSQWRIEWFRAQRKRLLPINPWVRYVGRHAAAVLAANRDTRDVLERVGADHVCLELETAIDADDVAPNEPHPGAPFTLLWAGQLVPRKGAALAIDVIAELRLRGQDVRLRMAGEGPTAGSIARKVRAAGLEGQVELLGSLPHLEMDQFYRSGDAFLFTSLQDTSGNVLLEAMARGIPVVTLDHHGASEIVDERSGLRVTPATPMATVRGFADAVQTLADDRALSSDLGAGARQRVRDVYSWDRKAVLLRDLYARAAASPGRP